MIPGAKFEAKYNFGNFRRNYGKVGGEGKKELTPKWLPVKDDGLANNKVKVKQSHYRPGQTLRVPGG
jgi:hypothetical protein